MDAGIASVLSSLATGGLAFIGVLVTNNQANKEMKAEMQVAQAVTNTKIDELTREVREHNNFAKRVPVLESKVEALERRVDK